MHYACLIIQRETDPALRLQRELAFLARKQDVRLAQEERRRWAKLTKEGRSRTRP